MPKIVIYPNKVLRKKANKVDKMDAKTKKDIASLVACLSKADDGAGLAGPQIGISKRILALKNKATKMVTVYINPRIDKVYGDRGFFTIESESESEDFLEGCLSFPNYFGTVRRFSKIDLSWQEVRVGKLVGKKASLEGFEAIVMQHETDHLDGVLFIDYIKSEGGKFYKAVEGELVEWDILSI